MRTSAALLPALLAACGPSREQWWDALAEAMCDTRFDCDERASLHYWEDEDECAEEILSLVDTGRFETCEYDRSAARACLSAWHDVECEPAVEQYEDTAYWCDQVWYCP